jgi:acetylornithine deacetylase/succinyl-diaminopimelate desuccinylase-like protein
MIGTIRGARPGPTFVFDGHMDVVPIGGELWDHEPYGGEIDGKIWGGTADMKVGLPPAFARPPLLTGPISPGRYWSRGRSLRNS